MKKLVKNTTIRVALFGLLIVMGHHASAQGKHDESWKQSIVMNLKNTVAMADEAQAEANMTKTFSMKSDEKSAWLRDNTVIIRNIRMAKVEIGELKNGTIMRRPVMDTVLSVRFLRLEKFLSANYVGELHALYVANEDAANKYNPAIVFGFDLNGDNSTDWFAYDEPTKQHGVIYGKTITAQNTPGNQPGVTPGSVPQGATKLPDGTIMGPGYMITPQGVTLIQQTNGSYLTIAQMQGLQQAPPTAPATKADSTERTASFSVNVKQSGDPNLLASNGSLGQGGSTKTVSKDPDEVEFWNQRKTYPDGTTVDYVRGGDTGGEWRAEKEAKPDVIEAMTLKPNQVLINKTTGEVLKEERKRESRKVRRLYDLEENAPTEGSARAVEAMNGGGGVGWAPIGMTWTAGGWVSGGGCYQTQQCYGCGGGPVAYGSSIWGQANCQAGWGSRR